MDMKFITILLTFAMKYKHSPKERILMPLPKGLPLH